MSQDLSGIIQSTGVSLEHQAFSTFGAAVADSVGGPLSKLFHLPSGTPSQTATSVVGEPGVWSVTHYASALVQHDQVAYNPKLKFLFKVSFEFDPAMADVARLWGYDLTTLQQNVSFLVQKIDRPKFDFEYEQVNMYNYKTKVLKTINHHDLTFTIYDDIGNSGLNFVNVYRKLLQPQARMEQNSGANAHAEDHGFAFDNTGYGLDTSVRGVLPSDHINILRKMTIHQVFVERGSTVSDPSSWVKMVDFVFVNPRFTTIDMDEMAHSASEMNTISFGVDFDTMYMDDPKFFTQSNAAPNFPTGDIPADSNKSVSPAGGQSNPFVNILVNQGARLVQQGVSDLITKKLGSGPIGTAIGGAIMPLGGILAQASRNTLSSVMNGGLKAISKPSAPVLVDTNTAPSQVQNLSSQP